MTVFILDQNVASAQVLPGCGNDITALNWPKILRGAAVPVNLVTSEPVGAQGVIDEALAQVSGQVNGVTFNLTNVLPPSGPVIYVSIAGDWDLGAGSYYGTPGANGFLGAGMVNIYIDHTGCNGNNLNAPCFDPANPAQYRQALIKVITHEILHSLNASNSDYSNAMGPFVGVNSWANINLELDCVLRQIRRFAEPPPVSCS